MASDGSLSPSALVWAARAGGLHVIALTDHDTTAGYSEAAEAGRGSVHVVPGIEVSTTFECRELHMLGYFVDPDHPALQEHESEAMTRRRDRMAAMIDALRAGGLTVPFEAVAAEASGSRIVARPHLARVLVQRGHAATVSDAFDRWIGDACPAYRPVNLVTPYEAIERIHCAGGIAVWAHPELDLLRREVRRFAAGGLDGIECYRPRCPPEDCLMFERTAEELRLYATGGSDWHGVWNGRLGTFSLSHEEVGAVLEYGGI